MVRASESEVDGSQCVGAQPVYHSDYNEVSARVISGCSVLPLKSGPSGPAPISPAGENEHIDSPSSML
jgi:hypothetical protein